MTGVLAVLAALSAVGGFFALPHFLEPMLPLPDIVPALHHHETTLIGVAVVLAFAGLAAAAFLYGGDARRAAALRTRFPLVHGLLFGKYFVDEAYDFLISRPLLWVSDRVFLRIGDRVLLDGTLNGLAAWAQRTAGSLGRIQTGNLQLYAFLALAGVVVALVWTWAHV
jgi:NADH-quinone oxidoreductase subunit L